MVRLIRMSTAAPGRNGPSSPGHGFLLAGMRRICQDHPLGRIEQETGEIECIRSSERSSSVLGLGLVTLFFVSIIIFSAVEMLPGDFAKAILGQSATPETVAAFEQRDRPRSPGGRALCRMDRQASCGEFGQSLPGRVGYQRTVTEMIAPRLYNTLFLAMHDRPHRRAAGAGARRRWPRFTATAASTGRQFHHPHHDLLPRILHRLHAGLDRHLPRYLHRHAIRAEPAAMAGGGIDGFLHLIPKFPTWPTSTTRRPSSSASGAARCPPSRSPWSSSPI